MSGLQCLIYCISGDYIVNCMSNQKLTVMKSLILSAVYILLFVSISNAQEIIFPNSVLSAGGELIKSEYIQISRWRIGSINVLSIDSEANGNKSEIYINNHSDIKAYPNPTSDFLNIRFTLKNPINVHLEIIDVKGECLIQKKEYFIAPEEILHLDLTKFTPALYLFNITSKDSVIHRSFKVVKQ